ncbi:MAG TPA: hypothetical protein PLE74_12750, partial [Candidatus Cloacimonadota bacterium]|nr:hypothetical protein [Candidatus Cloacimonadota bacterium]
MKKVTIIVILSIFASMLLAMEYSLESRIDRYSGKNAEGLKQLLQTTSPDTLRYIHYILDNASSFDLAVLTPDFIMMNIRLSMKTKELPYTKNIPEDIFTHFVLLPRISQEPFVEWR